MIMFLEILIFLIFVSLCVLVYKMLYTKSYVRYTRYIKEFTSYITKLSENRTIFKKRLDNSVYIEYGIDKIFMLILPSKNDKIKIRLIDEKTKYKIFRLNKFPLNIFNKILIRKTLKKYKNEIEDVVDYNGTMMDKKTYEIIMSIIDLTVSELKSDKNKLETSEIKENLNDFNIDDILDKINKVGYSKLTKEEKNFLKNFK